MSADHISDAARRLAETSAEAQGLPPKVRDKAALRRVAALLKNGQ